MQNDKNKAMVARLEHTLTTFIRDLDQKSLSFPPRSAFHRRVCYAVGKKYGLAHRLVQNDNKEMKCLVLMKTNDSNIPLETLAKFADAPQPSATSEQPPLSQNTPVAARVVVVSTKDENVVRPATFLRRPRSAEGRLNRVPLAMTSCGAGLANGALKSISEEDYQKYVIPPAALTSTPCSFFTLSNTRSSFFFSCKRRARARIFQPAPISDEIDQSDALAQDLARAAKADVVAKGPVEGSTGFDRRRNRRNPAVTAEKQLKRNKSNEGISEPPRANIAPKRDQFPRNTAPVSQPPPLQNYERNDLQDPDFDRRYDKWAVRRVPAPQQVPVPIFGQLLYPYAVQPMQNNMHIRPVPQMQAGAAQYQSMMHPSGMMYQHVGHMDYGMDQRYAMDMDAHSHAFAQSQTIPAQIRQRSPSYGLDSTVDFPPLP